MTSDRAVEARASVAPGTTWQYRPAEDLDQSLSERLRQFPRQPDLLIYGARWFAALVIRAWLRIYLRLTIVGREHLPRDRSFILVANHSSHLDAIALQAALPLRQLHRTFCAAACDYFFQSLPLTWVATIIANALPFSRECKAGQSLALCAALLQSPGNVLILFPEGTRTATGALGSFKPGVGVLLAGKETPVIPCFLDGAFKAWPRGRFFSFPGKLTLRIGAPRTYANVSANKEGALAVAADLERAVTDLGRSPAR